MFIDTQNMYYSARNIHGRKVNFGNIVEDAVAGRKLIRAIAYVVSTKTGEEKPFFEALRGHGIETREKELMEYLTGIKKADWDVGLTVDVIRMIDMLDVVVIASGDGDFVPLVDFVKSRGRIVEIVSFRETTSTRLVESADQYVNLSDNKRRYLIGQKREPIKPEKGAEIVDAGEIFDEPEDFEDSKKTTDDIEETRRRRLSF